MENTSKEEEMVSEFIEFGLNSFQNNAGGDGRSGEIALLNKFANYWLKIRQEALTEQKEKIIKKIQSMPIEMVGNSAKTVGQILFELTNL